MFLFRQILREFEAMIDPKIQAAVDTLRATIEEEKAEYKLALKTAIDPLLAQIAELKAAIEAGSDVSAIVEAIEESAIAVEEIVTIDPPVVEPVPVVE